MKYHLEFTTNARRLLEKYIKKNKILKKRIINSLDKLAEDQFDAALKTHKVNTKYYGLAYSSRVAGDVRIIWNFHENQIAILVLTIGSHSGNKSVY